MKKFIKYFFIFTFVIGLYVFSTTAFATTNAEWQAMVKSDFEVLKQKGVVGSGFNINNIRQPDYNLTSAYFIFKGSGFSSTYSGSGIGVAYVWFPPVYSKANSSSWYQWYAQINRDSALTDCRLYDIDTGTLLVSGGFTFEDANIVYIYTTCNINTTEFTLSAGEEYGGSYLTESFEFNPVHSQIVNTSSGYLGVHAYKYDYSISKWRLGIISEYLSEYPIYHLILYNQLYASGDDIIAEGYYNNTTLENTSADLFVSNNEVYIKSRLLSYNVVYTLMIYPETLTGSFSNDNYQGTFIFLPLNSSISGDSITDAGSGGYSQQDSTNDILNTLTDTSDIGDALSISTFNENSGDIATAMGYTDFDNPFYDFIIGVWDEILDLFEASPNNQQLSFTIHGNTYFIQSDDYMIPDSNPLKIFVSSALTVGCIFLIYQYFAKIIYALTCLDLQGVMKGTDVDMSIFM